MVKAPIILRRRIRPALRVNRFKARFGRQVGEKKGRNGARIRDLLRRSRESGLKVSILEEDL
jgi:hypothetical protein